jgi:2-polyprenyl-6-methoxyphenol hydroxylase-like FAD-dependent oxidoreductase
MGSQIDAEAPLETDVLIVGGGPVGMFAALRLSQLGQSCTIIEQNSHTTVHPKMEYSSHRTMEIYRRIGLLDHVKPQGVPETYGLAELFATGIGGRNLAVARIVRYYLS